MKKAQDPTTHVYASYLTIVTLNNQSTIMIYIMHLYCRYLSTTELTGSVAQNLAEDAEDWISVRGLYMEVTHISSKTYKR